MSNKRTASIFVQAAMLQPAWRVGCGALLFLNATFLTTAFSFPVDAKQTGQQHQLNPVLQAIDPSQAHEAPIEPNQVPPQAGQTQPAAGWTAGYYPAQPTQQRAQEPPLQAPGGPDDPRLAKLEQLAFGSTYPEHDADDRIEHLEREEFGKVFQGDSESRIRRLAGKLNPQGAFSASAPLGIPQQQQNNLPRTTYQPPQQAQWQPPPNQPPSIPQQAYNPSAGGYRAPQQSAWQSNQAQTTPQQSAWQQSNQAQQGQPPSIPQQPYLPQRADYQPPQQPAWQQGAPPSIPQQPYNGQPGGYQPPQPVPPPMVPPGAPPSIPAGPVTMSSFNRQPSQPPANFAPSQPAFDPAYAVPPQQAQQQQYRRPQSMQRTTPPQPPPMIGSGEGPPATAPGLLDSVPYDKKAGDYLASISRMGGSFARWTTLPVRVHVPMNTPESAREAIEGAVKRWAQFIPVIVAPPTDPADIEIGWINHLMPRQLGITNLEIFNGRPRVTVYLLRPNYYPPDVAEGTLNRVCLHELGHALGLYGHSPTPGDVMYALDAPKAGVPKTANVTQRDTNTLRRIYEAAPLPEGFQSGQPISWP